MQANQADAAPSAAAVRLPIRAMARMFQVSHSGYYDWLDRAPSTRSQPNVELLQQIRLADDNYPSRSGPESGGSGSWR